MDDNKERLQKVMASCGVASRRKCEEYITAGRVKVNGNVVTELGTKVSKKDIIVVDGEELNRQTLVYYALNKPTGYLTAVSDKLGRRTVMDLIDPETKKTRIFPVGRLDYDTSGLLLLTNDGNLSYNLTRSEKEVEKILDNQLKELSDRLLEKGLKLTVKPAAKKYMVEHGYDPEMGARPMRRMIQREIEDPMSIMILTRTDKSSDEIIVDCTDGKLDIKYKKTRKVTKKVPAKVEV